MQQNYHGNTAYQSLVLVGVIDAADEHHGRVEVLEAEVDHRVQQNDGQPSQYQLPVEVGTAEGRGGEGMSAPFTKTAVESLI